MEGSRGMVEGKGGCLYLLLNYSTQSGLEHRKKMLVKVFISSAYDKQVEILLREALNEDWVENRLLIQWELPHNLASPRVKVVAGSAKLCRYLRASPAQFFVSQQPVNVGVLP